MDEIPGSVDEFNVHRGSFVKDLIGVAFWDELVSTELSFPFDMGGECVCVSGWDKVVSVHNSLLIYLELDLDVVQFERSSTYVKAAAGLG